MYDTVILAPSTPVAVTSNSMVDMERPLLTPAPGMMPGPGLTSTPMAKPIIAQPGPASVSKMPQLTVANKPQSLPPPMLPPTLTTPPTLLASHSRPPAQLPGGVPGGRPLPTTPVTQMPSLSKIVPATTISSSTTPGALLSGLQKPASPKPPLITNKPKVPVVPNVTSPSLPNGAAKDKQLSFGMADESLLAKAISTPKSGKPSSNVFSLSALRMLKLWSLKNVKIILIQI